ncbi:MAG: hypothetical protein N3F64_02865 [Nitrososphaeria archaeon]|nr:hypothetical protein [Nitrososphaeria archaeon]
MDKHTLYIITFTILIMVSVSALAALGESRLDVYTSIYTLEYFTLTAIFRPRRKTIDFLAISLLMVFAYTVTVRVLEILFP